METSTKAGAMGAYKPRRPGTTYEDSMTSGDIKKMDAQKNEANTQKKTEEAYKTKSMASGGTAATSAISPEAIKALNAGTTAPANPQMMKKGGMTASSRADGCATKGKTKGRFV